MPVLHPKRTDFRGASEYCDDSPVQLIQSQWKICPEIAGRHTCELLVGQTIHGGDLAGVWNVHHDLRTRAFQLETLGVSMQRDICDFVSTRRIDHRQGSVPITDKDAMGGVIYANVVRVLTEGELTNCR